MGASSDSGGGAAVSFLAFVAFAAGVGGAVLAGVAPHDGEEGDRERAAADPARVRARRTPPGTAAASGTSSSSSRSSTRCTSGPPPRPSPGTRRVDIIGGTTYGWEAVLTVFGGSLLATRGHMTLVDFTGEALCGELMELAVATHRSVQERPAAVPARPVRPGRRRWSRTSWWTAWWRRCTATRRAPAGPSGHQDAMLLRRDLRGPRPEHQHGPAAGRAAGADRPAGAGRAQPRRRATGCSTCSRTRAAGRCTSTCAGSRRSCIPLESMGRESAGAGCADLTCLIADGDGGNAQNELLKDLMVQWLARQVRREVDADGLAGAARRGRGATTAPIEQLSTLCERRGIRLVLFFGHLREESLHTIGGGEVALMRLGNHQEASQAAEFIGKGHKFVLSQLTRTLGGNETHTLADTYGESETAAAARAARAAAARHSAARRHELEQDPQLEPDRVSRAGYELERRAVRRSGCTSTPSSRASCRTCPSTRWCWSRARAAARSCRPSRSTRRSSRCPGCRWRRSTWQPLPDPAEAVIPATRQPGQVTVSQPQPLAAHETSPHRPPARPARAGAPRPEPGPSRSTGSSRTRDPGAASSDRGRRAAGAAAGASGCSSCPAGHRPRATTPRTTSAGGNGWPASSRRTTAGSGSAARLVPAGRRPAGRGVRGRWRRR